MEYSIDLFLKEYQKTVKELFGERVVLIGIQGSYGREEAGPQSDIDMVLILDQVTAKDLLAYDEAVSRLPKRDKLCGFVSGLRELRGWDRADLFQFYYDTAPLFGSFDGIIPAPGKKEAHQAVLNGACGIYHMCAHNLIHEKSGGTLKDLYKSASFVIQAIHYVNTGAYVKKKETLLELLAPSERQILKTYLTLKDQPQELEADFYLLSETLLNWSGALIDRYAEKGEC